MTGNKETVKLPFWGTVLTLVGLIILCGLGSWQLQRLAWKQDILSKLEAAYENENVQSLENITFEEGTFIYGRAEGVFLADKALMIGPTTQDGEVGADLMVPLKTQNGTLLVNMGWTPYPLKDLPIKHLNNKKVRFEGLARAPDWNGFTPENEPENNRWYKADIEEISTHKALSSPLPYILYAESASHKFDAQFPNNQRWAPNNNHMQYALFWFAMAAAMLGIYVLRFLRK